MKRLFLILGLLLALTTSVTAAPTVTKMKLGSGNIPCLVAYLPDSEKLPIVFLHHGYGGNKENHTQRATVLAKRGYFVIVPDAGWHGERASKSGSQPSMIHIIVNSAQEDADILNNLKSDTRVDTTRVGIAGFSMGAMTAFVAPTIDKRFLASVPWCGNPDWSFYSNWGDARTQKLIKDFSPLTHSDKYYPCAILSQHGELDSGMPAYLSEELIKKLKKSEYKNSPNRLKVVEHPGIGHDVSLEMENLAWDWFDKFVKKKN